MKINTRISTEETHEIELTDADILDWLVHAGHIPPEAVDSYKVYVEVPGGGDWSNAKLDIDSETPLRIRWTKKTNS